MKLENITFSDVMLIIAAIVLLLVTYTQIMNAVKAWREERKRKNAPVESLADQVSANRERIEQHDQMLDNDKKRLDAFDEQQRLMLRGIMAILSHEINGNSTDKLQASMTEINDWLIKK